MAHIPLILKIVLCLSAFVTAFLGVFRRTIDDHKRLTGHGKACIVCVTLTFSIGIGNELMNLSKENRAANEKRAADDRAIVMQVKLDQALDEGKKRGDEAKAYMIEASESKKRLEAIQEKLVGIDVRVSDPTAVRLIGEVRRLTGSDIALTGEKLVSVEKTLADIHNDVGDVRTLSAEGRDSVRGARGELATMKLEMDAIMTDLLRVKTLVTPPPPLPVTIAPIADSGFLESGTFFSDGDKLLDAGR
jgi:hypothetical protein